MGRFTVKSRWLLITGWLATAMMAVAVAGMFLTWGKG
jgi:hypothetical protein